MEVSDYQKMSFGTQIQHVKYPPFATRDEGFWLRVENRGVPNMDSGVSICLGSSP